MSQMRVPLLGAVVLMLAAAVAVSLVPAGIGLDQRVTSEMRGVAVEDLGRAPMILEDRNRAQEEALAMHAMTIAATQGLDEALRAGRGDEAERLARSAASAYGEEPVVVSREGDAIVGPAPGPDELAAVRSGGTWSCPWGPRRPGRSMSAWSPRRTATSIASSEKADSVTISSTG